MIIHVQTFSSELGENITEPTDTPDLAKFRLVNAHTKARGQRQIPGTIIVIATIAFSMGNDSTDVWQIMHIGPPADPDSSQVTIIGSSFTSFIVQPFTSISYLLTEKVEVRRIKQKLQT